MNYSEKLRDPRWQKKRLEIMQRDGFACVVCEDTTKTLNVHHGYYTKALDPWEYDDETLWTLCEDCHRATEDKMYDIRRAVGELKPTKEALEHIAEYTNRYAWSLNGEVSESPADEDKRLACHGMLCAILRAIEKGVTVEQIRALDEAVRNKKFGYLQYDTLVERALNTYTKRKPYIEIGDEPF